MCGVAFQVQHVHMYILYSLRNAATKSKVLLICHSKGKRNQAKCTLVIHWPVNIKVS